MIVALTAVLAAVFVASCAEQKYDPTSGFQRESFDAWVKKYDPIAEKKASGIYVRFYNRDANWSELPAPVLNTSWLSINYTGRALSNNVFETRDSALTQLIGTWAITTHFVPDFVLYNQTQKLCTGMVDALSFMREGDSARIYIPSDLAYSSTMSVNSAYSYTGTTYINFPIYFDIALKRIVNDPYTVELQRTKKYAESLGFNTIMDSVDKGLYVRIVKSNPQGNEITVDSTVNAWYSSYFFDKKLVATNIDSIARKAGYYSSDTKYEVKTLSPANFTATTGTYLVFPKAVLKMRRGESSQVVAASWWGAGMSGDLTGKPQILPYESLVYDIYVEDVAK